MIKGYFVTGTDTDVGKTVITLGLIAALQQCGYKVGAMKPVSAGCEMTPSGLRNDDALKLQQQCGMTLDYDTINPYAFEPAIAPHIAADDARVRVDIETIHQRYQTISAQNDCVIVEGAGGWQVPLNDFQSIADLARRLQLPVILVVAMRLGCISHALLTAESIRAAGLPLAGWVANQVHAGMARLEENIATLRQRLDAPLLGTIPYLATVDAASVAELLTLPAERNSLRPGWAL